jgi:hypothetical protein
MLGSYRIPFESSCAPPIHHDNILHLFQHKEGVPPMQEKRRHIAPSWYNYFLVISTTFFVKPIDILCLLWYNIYNERERRETMSKKKQKKNGNQDKTVKIIILITALVNLFKSIVDLIQKFIE